MTTLNEFAELVKQLNRSPNDHVLKQAVVQHLPKVMKLFQDNPMDLVRDNPMAPMILYHLAHIYPATSSQYKQTMRQAANLGCTNAMLVMMQLLGNSNDVSDLQKATHYLTMIKKSGDSYILGQAQLLLDEYPQLAQAVQERTHAKPNFSSGLAHRFFAPQRKEESFELVETAACKA